MSSAMLGRRRFLGACACAACIATAGIPSALHGATGKRTELSAEQALQLLKEGNARFVADQAVPRETNRRRRLEIAQGQTPFCVLLGCSDSRVSPELLFGRGLGELFIARNAGNVVDTATLGSIEYAVAELGVPLIVVLGHQRCGAVAAALEVVERNATFPGVIGEMVEPIIPAVLKARSDSGTTDQSALLEAAVKENVRRVAQRLRTSQAVLVDPVRAGKLKIVSAYYPLDTGEVEFFEDA